MPLFKHHEEPSQEPARKGSIFSRGNRNSRSASPPGRTGTNSSSQSNGLFHRDNDNSISAARAKVNAAEEAERAADKALAAARNSVKEAHAHVKRLEREAAEEAKQAKAKQAEAKSLGKSARGLGRHS